MTPTREDHLEAAKLAKAVSSQLNMIDNFSTERRDVPANRIDINKFIAKVVQPNANIRDNNRGYIPEDMVQKMVPDTSLYSNPQNLSQVPNTPQPIQQNNEAPVPVLDVGQAVSHTPQVQQIVHSKDEHMERIATAIEKFVDCYVKCHTIEDQEKILNE